MSKHADDFTAENIEVRYRLHIEAEVELSGDYMSNSQLHEFLNYAKDNTRNWQVLVKQGATEPKPVRANITVQAVTINPRKR